MFALPMIDPEFKSLIPPLSPEEREQLEQNILSARRCHDAIVLWDSLIIDGYNRFEICMKHGLEFEIKHLALPSREAAKVWILENQLSRRNLSDAMRIEIALLKSELLRAKAKKNLTHGGRPGKGEEKGLSKLTKMDTEPTHVNKAVAADAGVSEGTLFSYTQIKEQGSPQLLESVQSGALKIGTAHRLLTKEILKQLTRAGKMYKFISEAAPSEGYKATHPDIHKKLTQLAATLRSLLHKLEERRAHENINNQPVL